MNSVPTIADTLAARQVVAQYHPRTPLFPSPALSRRFGCEVWVKYENHTRIRSFKARGALYCLSRLSDAERGRGVVTASTGNHGQGVAYAGGRLGAPATVVIPEGTPLVKVASMRDLGADLRVVGRDLTEAAHAALAIARDEGKLYIEDGEDGALMAGAASLAWEMLEEVRPDLLLVPVGGGNLIAAVALVARAVDPRIQVVGVQSEAAPAALLSWREKTMTYAACTTFAGGLATDHPGALALEVMRDGVDDMLLVSEDELRRGIAQLLATTGNVAEGAGAAAVAALERYPSRFAGRTVAMILSGGNIDVEDLRRVLEMYVNPTVTAE